MARERPGVAYRNVAVEGLSIVYREAGPQDEPMLLTMRRMRSRR